MAIYLPKGTLITIENTELSEHNRSPAQITYEPISLGERTIIGTLRQQIITYKRKLSISWDMLPALSTTTVDGFAGRNEIKALVDSAWLGSSSSLAVSYKELDSDGTQIPVAFNAFISDYNDSLVKRWDKHLWNVSLVLVEV